VGIAQVLYERNQLDDALEHATEGIERCRQVMVLRERDRGLGTLAWIRQARGEADAALDAINEACGRLCPRLRRRGPPMATLLRKLVADGRRGVLRVRIDYLGRILRGVGKRGVPAGPEALALTAGLAAPLTGRELEVLQLLAAGRGNQEIAKELVVTLETVKKHVSHIFDELGAVNCTQAVAHARQLGLVR
jgi:LuxR family transcriptional regulator, maltose regulon positive regulatory protein